MNTGMTTSKRGDWRTPQALYEELNAEFMFDIDVCASAENTKCDRFYTVEDDALSKRWGKRSCFMNPPYGAGIRAFVRKAWQEAMLGATVVCLLPARTDTSWWHDYVMRGEIRFIRGRIRFNEGKGRAPFPSAIVIFRPRAK